MLQPPILIVEDSPDDQTLLRGALEAAHINHPTIFCSSISQAESVLENANSYENPLPCLIILDLSFPYGNGYELLQQLQEDSRYRHIPVVILTQSCNMDDLMRSYCIGANSFINKDGHIEEFYEKIRYMCQYWLEVCQLPVPT